MFKLMSTTTNNPFAVQADPANEPQVNQVQQQYFKLKKMKYKTIAGVLLGLTFIIGAVLLTYMALQGESGPDQQVFQYVLHDTPSRTPIYLNVKVDNGQNVEYVTSPAVENNKTTGEVKGIRDGNSGFEAYINKDGDKCLVGKISAQDMFENSVNGSITEGNVEQTTLFSLLNQTIHPYVLGSLAGNNVVEFCGNRSAVWMIPNNNDDNLNNRPTHGRVKRQWYGRHNRYYQPYNYYRCFYSCGRRRCWQRCCYC